MRGHSPRAAGARACLVVGAALLTASCAGTAGTSKNADPVSEATPSSSRPASPSHHHTPGMNMPETTATSTASTPSTAATMVCTHITAEAVNRLTAPQRTLHPSRAWDGKTFTCTYDVPDGRIVLSVFDATDPAIGRRHFDTLQTNTPSAHPISGMADFGFPAFETGTGIVGFLNDSKTLLVDTTQLTSDKIGPDQYSRGLLSYELAATVIACWTG